MSIPQIQSIIQDVLQRAAKPGEAETWNALLNSNQLSLDGIADAIVNSAEATTTVDPVIRLFQGVYGRVPDKGGLDYWVDVYRDLKVNDNPNTPTVNEALVALARPFVDPALTPEFATRYGTNPDGNAYVSALYFNVLGRPADAPGLQYWEGVYNSVLQQQLGKGLTATAAALETRAILLEQFISSPEFITTSDPFITKFLTGAAQQVDPAGLYTGSLVNDAPTDITVAGLTSVAENSNPVAPVATFTSVDKDFGDAGTFSIVSDPSGYFEIVGNQLFVKAGAAVNFEAFGSVPVTVKVTDAGGATYQEVVTVTITNVNEAPTQVGPGVAAVNENAAAGTVVTTLATTDPDAGDTFTYALTTNPGGKFAISGNQVVVANGAVLDFESQSSYDIIVRSTDSGGLTVFRQVTVSINDVNEAPTGASLTGNSVAENSAAGTVVGTLSAQDPDGNPITYSISGGTGASLFEISGNQVVVKAGAALNFEATNSYTLIIGASDGSLSGPTGTFTVNVTNVNEAPTALTGVLGPVAETAVAGANVGTVATTDPDAGQTFTYAIVGGTAAADFVIAPNGQVTVAPTANLVVTADEVRTLVIRSTDQGGLFTEQSFNVTVTNDVNAPGGNFSAVPGGVVNGTDNNDVFSGTDVTAQGATFNGGAGRDTVALTLSNQLVPPGIPTNNIVNNMVGNSIEEVVTTVANSLFGPGAPTVNLSGFASINKVATVQSVAGATFTDIQNSNVDFFITDVANGLINTFDFDAQAVAGAADAARLHMQEAGGTGAATGQTVVFTQNTVPGPASADGGLETLTLFTSRAGTPTANDTVALDALLAGNSLTTLNIATEVGGLTANLNIGDSGTATSLAAGNGNLNAIDASQHAGAIDIFIAGDGEDYDGSYRGGSANDTVRIGDALADGFLGAFDGGAGTNVLHLVDHGSLDQSLAGAPGQFTNFSRAIFDQPFAENSRLDTALLRGITTFDLTVPALNVGPLEIERLLANTTHTFNITKTNNGNPLDIDLDVGANDGDPVFQNGDGTDDRVAMRVVGSGQFNISGDEIEVLSLDFRELINTINVAIAPAAAGGNDLQTLNVASRSFNTFVTSGANPNLTTITSTHSFGGDVIDLLGLQVSASGATFTGGFGVDRMQGGSGNDTFNTGADADLVFGGGGNDTANGGTGFDTVNGEAGNDVINGEAGKDVLNGGADNDLIDGGIDSDTISGNAGDDTITGGDENPNDGDATNRGDLILGDDIGVGVTGNDLINAGAGNDTVDGGAGNDVINGQADNDALFGGAGNDTIAGGTGADTMTGGASGQDPLDAAVAATLTVTVGGVIGDGDTFTINLDTNGPAAGGAVVGAMTATAVVGDTPATIAAKLVASLATAGFNASAVGAVITISETDGSGFSVTTATTDGAPDEILNADRATIAVAAQQFDGGDVLTFDVVDPITATTQTVSLTLPGANSVKYTADQVAALLATEVGADITHMVQDLAGGPITSTPFQLQGSNPTINYTVNNATVTNVAATNGSFVFDGSAGLNGAEYTVGGTSFAVDHAAVGSFAALQAALNAAVPGAGLVISVAGGDATFTTNPGFGQAVRNAITGFAATEPGETLTAPASVINGVTVTTNSVVSITNFAPTTADDLTQSLTASNGGSATNGVLAQTNGNDKFIVEAGATLATMDVVTDFGQGSDTLSFAGATVAGSAVNTVNSNLLSNGDLVGFTSLDAAILFANTVLNGNPQVEYLTAWVESNATAGFQAGFDQVFVLADVNSAGASDNIVSQVVGLQDFGATTISGTLITL